MDEIPDHMTSTKVKKMYMKMELNSSRVVLLVFSFFSVTSALSNSTSTSTSTSTCTCTSNGNHLRSAISYRHLKDDADCMSIADTICSMNNSERFCEVLMSYSGALRSLADPGKNVSAMMDWMVFVPDDDAFQVIDETIGLTDDEVNRILVFYFYKNIMLSYDELVCGETLTSQSENDESRSKCDKNPGGNGNDETVVKYQNGNGNTKHGSLPKITTNDIMACNGIIHAIGHVMFPVMLEELEQQSYGNTTGKIEVKVFGW